MDKYYEVLKSLLTTGDYDLADATSRIDFGVAAGKMTADQAAELLEIAQANAGGRDLAAQLDAVIVRLRTLEVKVDQLKAGGTGGTEPGEDGDEPGEPVETIPDWKMPTGSHDAYAIGDKVRYNGKVWVSNIAANTTVPGSDPRWWTMVE